jgi:multidrug efflux pump subunit AcrA (membrane-fusion protein)
VWGGPPAAPALAPAPDTPPSVAVTGRIEPHSEVINLNAGPPGLLERLLVVRGERIGKGRVLGYLQEQDVEVAEPDEIAAANEPG